MAQRPTTSELIADGTVHAIAIVLAVVSTIFLILHATWTHNGITIAAVSVYCGIMILSFAASGVYNLWPWTWMREPLRRVDHAAIYLKIAGTYTPLVVILGTLFGYLILGAVWAVALAGAIGKLAFAQWPRGLNTGLTLSLGWASLILLWPLAKTIPGPSLALIFLGGMLYTVGTVFYLWEGLRYHTAIWHGFVLTASASIFAAIALALA